jgi:hypothetical protein
LRAPKPRGYASEEEKNAAFQNNLLFAGPILPEAERKEVGRRVTEYYDDEAEQKHRKAGLPWTSKSTSGYANSQEANAAYNSLIDPRSKLTKEESDDLTSSVLRFHSEQTKFQREVDERRGSDIVINLEALPANIRIVYERFMTKPVDGEDAYNSFVEFFDLQWDGNAPQRSSMMDNFLIAVAQYEMRAYLVPDTATNAMNSVLNNLAVALDLGREYITPGGNRFHDGFAVHGAFSSPAASASYARSLVGPSRTVSDAIAVLAIDDTVELTVDVVEAAFENNAAIMVAEGERDIGATGSSIMALKHFRQARSILLRSL